MVVAGALFNSSVQGLCHIRAVEVIFPTSAVLNKTHEFELAAIQLWVSLGMESKGFISQLRQTQTRHAASGSGESQLN